MNLLLPLRRDVKVDGVQAFGCFVDVLPGKSGLVHVRWRLEHCFSSKQGLCLRSAPSTCAVHIIVSSEF